jgi:ribonuclease HII
VPLVAGIDEAGYGPTLGPLVVGATLWNVPPRLLKADHWDVLHDCVRRSVRRGDWHLAVDDSKTLYNRKKGIRTLERSVLAFAHAAGLELATLETLLTQLGVRLRETGNLPWYHELGLPLPTDRAHSKYQAVAQRLKHSMAETGVICCSMMAEVVTEAHFNQRVSRTRNKAAVLIEQVLRLIQSAAEHAGGQDLVVRVDRIGGRADYRPLLADAFPDRHLHVLDVAEHHSRYRLAATDNDWFIEFAVDADKNHLPVALASMLAKYLREVLMQQFNAHWQQHLPGLRATAGYYTDARRFLSEIEPVLADSAVPRDRFIRSR